MMSNILFMRNFTFGTKLIFFLSMAQELQEQVKQALVDQSFRRDTLAQLAKDFQRCGLTLLSTDVDDLLSSIATCIKNVSTTQLQQLIYLIDIPESIFISLSRKRILPSRFKRSHFDERSIKSIFTN